MRSYVARFTKILKEAISVSTDRAIDAFVEGIRRESHIQELGRRKPQTVTELMEIANGWADGEDLARRSRPRDENDDSIKRTRTQANDETTAKITVRNEGIID